MSLPPGFTMRPVDPEADLEAAVELFTSCDLEDIGERDDRTSWTVQAWKSEFLVGAWLVRDDRGRPAAYIEIASVDPSRSIDAVVPTHPRHRDGALRPSLISFARERAGEAAKGDVALWLSDASTDERFARDVVTAGFRRVRVFLHMERPVDASYEPGEPPPGVTIRSAADPEDDRTIWSLLEESFKGHFGIEPLTFERFLAEFKDGLYDASLVLVAEAAGRPVGVAANWIVDGFGWVGDLGVLPAFRGRGIGAALLRHSFAVLAGRGVRKVRLNVDSENATGATRLYEAAGMAVRRSFDVYETRLAVG